MERRLAFLLAAVLNMFAPHNSKWRGSWLFVAAVLNCLLTTIASGEQVGFFVAAVLNADTSVVKVQRGWAFYGCIDVLFASRNIQCLRCCTAGVFDTA